MARGRGSQKYKKSEKWEGVSTPKPYGGEVWLGPHLCPSEDLAKRLEKRKKKLGPPSAPRHPAEEEGAASSTRLLVTLRHHRKLGDAPTYKTHQGNGETTKKREERGRRMERERTHWQWGCSHGNGEGRGSSRGFKKGREPRGRTPGPPSRKRPTVVATRGRNRG